MSKSDNDFDDAQDRLMREKELVRQQRAKSTRVTDTECLEWLVRTMRKNYMLFDRGSDGFSTAGGPSSFEHFDPERGITRDRIAERVRRERSTPSPEETP